MVLDLLFNPDGFFKEEVEFEKPMWRGLAVVLVASILAAVNAYIISSSTAKALYDLMIEKGASVETAKALTQFTQTIGLISAFFGVIISWVLIAAILQGLSALFGGTGKFSDTLKVTAYSFIPNIVVFPFTYYIAITEAKLVSTYGILALTNSGIVMAKVVLDLAVLAWQFLLWRFGIKYARNLSGRDATIVAAIPAVAFALLSIAGIMHAKTFQGVGGRTFK